MPETENAEGGRIVTFYSYKGGTGRSMAMANVSWLLALSGFKVLVIDWDLEAPGLHRYFRPFLEDADLTESEGVIDFVIHFVEAASEQVDEPEGADWYKPHSSLLPYARELDYEFPGEGRLDLIPAGRQDSAYAVRVNSFNWQHFYEKLNGGRVLSEARRLMKKEYDYVLIDSRTGVSDTAGICTVEMPDDLVVGFTLNLQSVLGASKTAASIAEQRAQRGCPIRVFPIPMRVEPNELIKTGTMKAYAKPRFVTLLPPEMTDEQKDKYWGDSNVPYIPFYAFEENLAYFRDEPNSSKTVLASMIFIANQLTPAAIGELPKLDPEAKAGTVAAYDAFSGARAASVEQPKTKTAVYLCVDSDSVAAGLRTELENSGFDVLTRARFEKAKSAVFLMTVGEAGLTSQQIAELTMAERARIGPIYTVLLPGAQPETLPRLLLPYGAIDLRKGGKFALPDAANSVALTQLPLTPYPGLNPFTVTDGPVFIARGALTTRLVEAVARTSFVALIGPRHSGKTSLVQAGLIPKLKAGEPSGWEVRTAWPTSPVNSSARLLVTIDVNALAAAGVTEVPENTCVLAIAETPEQVSFCEQKLRVTAERIDVPPLSDAELTAAIEEPAARAGLAIDNGLAERIAGDLKNERAKLPLMQYVMSELYAAEPRGLLSAQKYERLGGVQMVERKCDSLLKSSGSSKALSALGRLVWVAENGAMSVQDVPETLFQMEDHEVLDAFVAAGVLVRDGLVVRFSDRIFLDRWPRLRQWVEENREFVQWRQRLDQSMAAWLGNQRALLLLSGEKLEEAKRQAAAHRSDLSLGELMYVDASVQNAAAYVQQQSDTQLQAKRSSLRWIAIGAVILLAGLIYYWLRPGSEAPVPETGNSAQNPHASPAVGVQKQGLWCYQEAASAATQRFGLTTGFGAYCHASQVDCETIARGSATASACGFVEYAGKVAWGGVMPYRGGYPKGRSLFRQNMKDKLGFPWPQPPERRGK